MPKQRKASGFISGFSHWVLRDNKLMNATHSPLFRFSQFAALLFGVCWCVSSFSASSQNPEVTQAVRQFLQQQTAHLDGEVSIQVEEPDARLILSRCQQLEVYLPAGSQILGRSSIGVRCQRPKAWQILVVAQVKLKTVLYASARPLMRDQVISLEDLSAQSVEITRASGFSKPEQLVGKVLRYNISQGQILRDDMLRPAFIINQGQTVSLLLAGRGFSIRSEAVALMNASEGKEVRVRSLQGKVLSGIANADGSVTIRF